MGAGKNYCSECRKNGIKPRCDKCAEIWRQQYRDLVAQGYRRHKGNIASDAAIRAWENRRELYGPSGIKEEDKPC